MSDIKKSFDERAHEYDQLIECICPYYGEAFEALKSVLPEKAHFILELGCGTGNLSTQLLDRYKSAQLTVVDVSSNMLDVTHSKLSTYKNTIMYIEKEFSTFSSDYKFDIIVSSLAIHHLDAKEKERLFDTLLTLLNSGGYFYMMDSMRGNSDALEKIYHQRWVAYMRDHALAENEITKALERRRDHDKCDPLPMQLQLLKKSGFVDIDVIFKRDSIAVFGGRKY